MESCSTFMPKTHCDVGLASPSCLAPSSRRALRFVRIETSSGVLRSASRFVSATPVAVLGAHPTCWFTVHRCLCTIRFWTGDRLEYVAGRFGVLFFCGKFPETASACGRETGAIFNRVCGFLLRRQAHDSSGVPKVFRCVILLRSVFVQCVSACFCRVVCGRVAPFLCFPMRVGFL